MENFVVCFGAFLFGNILSWGGPTLKHLDTLEHDERKHVSDFAWVTSVGPLAVAIGIGVWGFLTRRIGPKKTLLCHSPFMLFSWFLMAYFDTYKTYVTSHFISAFCSASFIYSGDSFLTETVHRKNIKTFYAFFKASVILGIFSMNIINTFLDKLWLCVVCANLTVICFILTCFLPDSPVYLIQKREKEAEKSLRFYLGRETVGPELNIIRQHVNFFNFGALTYKHMLTKQVIIKAIFIAISLQFFRIATGYYAFILDSIRMFTLTRSLFSPYVDNIIFGSVLFITKFIGCFAHLRGNFGVKKPMLISLFLCAVVLLSLGFVHYFYVTAYFVPMKGTTLMVLSCFSVTYEIGINVCPDILLYEYMPHQLYEFSNKLMMMLQWVLIFINLRLYMEGEVLQSVHITMWILSAVTLFGFIFVAIFVVDTKGKSLMNIQMELGGNPVGSRGSTRQRLPSPFEKLNEMNYLNDLITNDLVQRNFASSSHI